MAERSETKGRQRRGSSVGAEEEEDNDSWGQMDEEQATLTQSLAKVKEVAASLDEVEQKIATIEIDVGERTVSSTVAGGGGEGSDFAPGGLPPIFAPKVDERKPSFAVDSSFAMTDSAVSRTGDSFMRPGFTGGNQRPVEGGGVPQSRAKPQARKFDGHLEDLELPTMEEGAATQLSLPSSFDLTIELEDCVVELGEMGFHLENSKLMWAQWALQVTPEAVIIDLFWWFFAEFFRNPGDADVKRVKEILYSRFAIHYVSVNLPPNGKRPPDRHLRLYPKCLAQVVYHTFRGVFTKSVADLGPTFLDHVINQMLLWTMGIMPDGGMRWSQQLLPGGPVRDRASTEAKLSTDYAISGTIHTESIRPSKKPKPKSVSRRTIITGAGVHMPQARPLSRDGAVRGGGAAGPEAEIKHSGRHQYIDFNLHQRTPFVSKFLEGHSLAPGAPFGHVVRRTRLAMSSLEAEGDEDDAADAEDEGDDDSYARFATAAVQQGRKAAGSYDRARRQLGAELGQTRGRLVAERNDVERRGARVRDRRKEVKKISDEISGWGDPNEGADRPLRGAPEEEHPMRAKRSPRRTRMKDSLDVLAHMVVRERTRAVEDIGRSKHSRLNRKSRKAAQGVMSGLGIFEEDG